MPADANNTDRRKQLRNDLIAAREALDAFERQRLSATIGSHVSRLLTHLRPSTLSFYWPFRNEPDLTQIVANWLAEDNARRAALPVVIESGQTLGFRAWQPGMELVCDRYGIPIPPTGEWLVPELLLIPLNGFDARGFRLGYGGGYFDRTLAHLSASPIAVGVGFEIGRVARLPEELHDHPMDWIVTESGWVVTPESNSRSKSR